MSISQTITKTWQGQSGVPIQKSVAYTGTEELNLDFALAGPATNQAEPLAFVEANLLSIYIFSDQTITIKTNSTTAPQETLDITAGDPLQWDKNSGLAVPFAGNVTTGYFTNATTTTANVSVRTLIS